uniref:non-specific serine/threonine protein kinase n=1 Tax=Glossina austeni TaxID=7395 RepID=A0A1A9UEM7_GLOAU
MAGSAAPSFTKGNNKHVQQPNNEMENIVKAAGGNMTVLLANKNFHSETQSDKRESEINHESGAAFVTGQEAVNVLHEQHLHHQVTWFNDDETDTLDLATLDIGNMLNRVDSAEIIYQQKKKNIKMAGKYVMGDVLGEGSYDVLYNDEKQKMYLIMEYCVGGLQEMLDSAPQKKMPLLHAHRYFRQLIILEYHETLKISDFGVAEQLELFAANDICLTGHGSPAFQPPEIANGFEAFSGSKVDIWSSGVTLYNLCTGLYPLEGDNIYRLLENIGRGQWQTPDRLYKLDEHLATLTLGVLQFDPDKRYTIQPARQDSWFMSAPEEKGPPIPIPPLKNDKYRRSTVLPYLDAYHYEAERDFEEVYFTEHDLNRELARKAAAPAAEIKAQHQQQHTLTGPSTTTTMQQHTAASCSNSASHHTKEKKSSSLKRHAKKLTSCISVRKLSNCRPS